MMDERSNNSKEIVQNESNENSVDDAIHILLSTHFPENQKALNESSINLDKIADYCDANYLQSDNKKEALEITSNYTRRSLASISSQIHNYASNLAALLSLLDNQMDEHLSKTSYIDLKFKFHQEKAQRREIGRLTKPKLIPVQQAIIYPERPKLKMPTKLSYTHDSIDYSILDNIGIGHKIHDSQNKHGATKMTRLMPQVKSATLRPSKSSNLSSILPQQQPIEAGADPLASSSQHRTPAPTVRPPTPPMNTMRFSSLSRGSKDYRALHSGLIPPPVIAPPQLPTNYGQSKATDVNKPEMESSQKKPPSSSIPASASSQQTESKPGPLAASSNKNKSMCDSSNTLRETSEMINSSDSQNSAETASSNWIPANYIEKVVAIYDYTADKDDELSLQENSVIYVIRKNDDGWWEGVLNGITGLFPGNYVEPCV